MKADDQIPDYPEPITLYRGWLARYLVGSLGYLDPLREWPGSTIDLPYWLSRRDSPPVRPRLESLYSLNGFTTWPVEGLKATCGNSLGPQWFKNRRGHVAPEWDCQCGIYAFRTPELLAAEFYGFPSGNLGNRYEVTCLLIGEIEASGKLIRHTRGYRVEFAKVTALYLWNQGIPLELIRQAAAYYRVPVLPVERLEHLRRWDNGHW